MRSRSAIADAGRDLAFGSTCVGCGVPGRVLCRSCTAALPRGGRPAWPTPTPAGLALPFAAGEYDGLLKAVVVQHKEHGVFALAAPLGQVLAEVVGALVTELGPGTPVLLVPVPSRRAVVRRRGHDPLLRVSRRAAVCLRGRGIEASVRRLLVPTGQVRDQAALTARERASNLAGSLTCRSSAVSGSARVVVVDDVITTGSTAREAQRALEEARVPVAAVASVAATRRRTT